MNTLLLSALLLLPAIVSAWPGYSRPTQSSFPPAFSLPPININLGGFSFSLPEGIAAYFGTPTASTDSAEPSDSTPAPPRTHAPVTSASPNIVSTVQPTDDTSATDTVAPTSGTTEGARPDVPSVQSPLGISSYIGQISSAGNNINGNTAGSLTVRYAQGSPSVSYNKRSRSAEIRAKLVLSSGASATCKLRRGNRQIVSKDCSSGSFSHTVRKGGSHTLVVEASDSNNNKVTRAQAVQVRFN